MTKKINIFQKAIFLIVFFFGKEKHCPENATFLDSVTSDF